MTQKTDPTSFERPLSPHLQVYRPQLTSMMSIFHRITGAALVAGTALLVGWLWSAAYSPGCFTAIHTFFSGILGKLLLIGWSFAFYYHFCNGIRHLFWDIGKGFEIPNAYRSGYAVLIASAIFTICTWMTVFANTGVSQ